LYSLVEKAAREPQSVSCEWSVAAVFAAASSTCVEAAINPAIYETRAMCSHHGTRPAAAACMTRLRASRRPHSARRHLPHLRRRESRDPCGPRRGAAGSHRCDQLSPGVPPAVTRDVTAVLSANNFSSLREKSAHLLSLRVVPSGQ